MPSTSASVSSSNFNAVTAVFEESANETSYTVYEIQSDGRVLNSQFTSKTKAFDFARSYTAETSQVYVYKTKCIKIFDADRSTAATGASTRSHSSTRTADSIFAQNVDMLIRAAEAEEDTDPEYVPSESEDDDQLGGPDYDLTGLTFSEYGKGYLLMPNRSTQFRGVKYLNQGWWNQSQGGWFFRSQYYDDLIAAGASYSGSSCPTVLSGQTTSGMSDDVIHVSPFSQERDLSGFSIEPYGKGFIVRCARSNPLFKRREPYLLGNLGWWNSSGNGWFFQSRYLAEVQRLGATSIKQEPSSARSTRSTRSATSNYVTSDSQFMEDGPSFERYGKGWMLRASDTYTFAEHGKYFQGGFWMPQQKGWFFRRADKEKFVA